MDTGNVHFDTEFIPILNFFVEDGFCTTGSIEYYKGVGYSVYIDGREHGCFDTEEEAKQYVVDWAKEGDNEEGE